MPLVSVTDYIDKIYDHLEDAFKDYHGLAYKDSTDPDSGSNTSKPDIYKYLMPSSDLIEGYPAKSPAIVIAIDSIDADHNANISLYLCVKYEAVSEKEKVKKVLGSDYYEYLTDAGYDLQNVDVDLYKTSLRFTEYVFNIMSNCTSLDINDLSINLPQADLPDYPYAVSSVSFNININPFKVSQQMPFVDTY